jgi:hypothetical protein
MFVEQLAVSLCLLCVRLRAEYGRSARDGPSAIKNERALDTPSFAVTSRLLAAARIWIMMRAHLTDHRITIPPRYVEGLRAHFIRMFVDFVEGNESREDEGKWPSPSCPAENMQNIEIQSRFKCPELGCKATQLQMKPRGGPICILKAVFQALINGD